MSDAGRIARGVLGVIVLIIIVVVVNGWWGEYRRGDAPVPSAEATSTPEPAPEEPAAEGEEPAAETPEASGATVIVLIEGLNFRKEPSREGELIRGLTRGTRLEHIETVDAWYRVKDESGVEGYVSSSPQYTELQQ
jgi:ABC-type lipoprotein release transport system permease subunit